MATKKSGAKSGRTALALSALNSAATREFRKTNDAIGLRVVEGSLTLLSRKVFNVMIYHAQEMKEPGLNAPIDTPSAKRYFWIPLTNLAREASYDSKDTKSLKEMLEGMQNIKLLLETERQWTSERLVSSVTLVNPEGLGANAGQVWFGYAFPPEVHAQVMAPSTYTRLSIVYQSSLKSGSGLALYEICRRYATNPSRMTFIQSVEHWHGVITGNPPTPDNPPLYKYFKRDILKPAIAEINALTDITIELVEHKNGKRVEGLQFRVELVKQTQLEFPAPPVIDSEIIERIMKFGFSKSDASDIVAQNDDDVIRMAISRVEVRAASTSMSALGTPAGYFRWQLRDLVKNQPQLQHGVKPTVKKSAGPSALDRFLTARATEALDVYKELDDKERKSVFDGFRENANHKSLKLERGIESATVRSAFAQWYAKELWGEASAEALARFMEQFAAEG